jgi:hypothetical protein
VLTDGSLIVADEFAAGADFDSTAAVYSVPQAGSPAI